MVNEWLYSMSSYWLVITTHHPWLPTIVPNIDRLTMIIPAHDFIMYYQSGWSNDHWESKMIILPTTIIILIQPTMSVHWLVLWPSLGTIWPTSRRRRILLWHGAQFFQRPLWPGHLAHLRRHACWVNDDCRWLMMFGIDNDGWWWLIENVLVCECPWWLMMVCSGYDDR